MRRLLVLMGSLALPVLAQQPTFDCAGSESHRQFDFWVGDWAVRDSEGVLQGQNNIRLIQNDCALQERWRSVKGGTGESINYYHPGEDRWHQLWVDGGASVIDISGGLREGSMVLEGSIYYLKQGNGRPLPPHVAVRFEQAFGLALSFLCMRVEAVARKSLGQY